MTVHQHTNRLIDETSPYLLQHAHNPVDWYPWGEEAFVRARAENKPVLLSIGYSACHWCHVMERESFEDEETAALMNGHFVNIKVDREERPDLDQIYMNAVQMMTGSGGWPMTVFLTPDGVPFYGGTYFPPEPRFNMPGFRQILLGIAEAYRTRPTEISESAGAILQQLRQVGEVEADERELEPAMLDVIPARLKQHFDSAHGGFGRAPKFPPSMTLEFLLRMHLKNGDQSALEMVEVTLRKMANGGIYDQIGGGFHRYSTDERWLVPHFEKMLYDNALLARVCLHTFQTTGDPFYRRICEETLGYVLREMTDTSGGFYSTQDADSEGHEGKFFIWSVGEVTQLLGEEDAALFCRSYDITEEGNFEGENILNLTASADVVAKLKRVTPARVQEALARGRKILFEAREKRVKPARDEKILSGWNGLMLTTFAEAGAVFGDPRYLRAARKNADFLLTTLSAGGRLLRSYKDGQAKFAGYLEDYAFVAEGLLALYQATFEPRWFREARRLLDVMLAKFWDATHGAFFFTADDHESLIARNKDFFDNAIPSGNSSAAHALIQMSLFTGETKYAEKAGQLFKIVREVMTRVPTGFGHTLCALDRLLSPPLEVAIIGELDNPRTQALLKVARAEFRPNMVLAAASENNAEAARTIPLLQDRKKMGDKATAYVCERFVCKAPVTSPDELALQLGSSATMGDPAKNAGHGLHGNIG